MVEIENFPYTIKDLQKICHTNKILWKNHATTRMLQRGIKRAEIIETILNGEIIEEYMYDKPFPSCLVFGYTVNNRPIHVVCSIDNEYLYIITAYIPDTIKWEKDLKTRKEL